MFISSGRVISFRDCCCNASFWTFGDVKLSKWCSRMGVSGTDMLMDEGMTGVKLEGSKGDSSCRE